MPTLQWYNISEAYAAMRVPLQMIDEIVRGRRGICTDIALRLTRVLGTSPEFWMSLQNDYDDECAVSGGV